MDNDQQQTSQPPSSPTQLRLAYQQRASAFLFHHAASHPNTSWIGDAARSLTLRAIYSRPRENSNDPHQSESTLSWRHCACTACGTPSYPPNPSATSPACVETPAEIALRALRRGRTRRRRASRSRAAQFQKEALFRKRIDKVGNADTLRSARIDNQRMRMASLHRLGDGRARHCVVVRCGFCGKDKKRKGVEIKSVGRRGAKTRKTDVAPTTTTASTAAKRHDANFGEARPVKEKESEESNFILLPTLGNTTQKKNMKRGGRMHRDANTSATTAAAAAAPTNNFSFKNTTTTTTTTTTSTPLFSLGKKKKAKKKPTASKGLMDFLSSLND